MGRREHRARFGNQRSGGDVLAPEDHVRVVGKFGVDAHGLFPAVGLLLHQDAVGPGGQRRTGHDAGRAADRQLCRGGIPGIELHHHRQGFGGHLSGPGSVGAVKRVAVQRAPVKGGLVHPGAERRSGDPSAGLVQPDILDRRPGQCRRGIQHTAQRLGRRTKRLFHRKISSILSRREPPSAMARTACPPCGFHRFQTAGKKCGDVLTENQNAPAENTTHTPRGCLQTAVPGGTRSARAVAAAMHRAGPGVGSMGGVLFFKL